MSEIETSERYPLQLLLLFLFKRAICVNSNTAYIQNQPADPCGMRVLCKSPSRATGRSMASLFGRHENIKNRALKSGLNWILKNIATTGQRRLNETESRLSELSTLAHPVVAVFFRIQSHANRPALTPFFSTCPKLPGKRVARSPTTLPHTRACPNASQNLAHEVAHSFPLKNWQSHLIKIIHPKYFHYSFPLEFRRRL